MLNMQMTHSSWLVLSRLLHLLQHLAARIGLLLNGSKCPLIVIHGSLPVSLSLSLSMLTHTEPVTVHIVRLSFKYHNEKIPLTSPCNPCKVRNILDPSLPLLHPQSRMSTFDVSRPPPPSRLWIHFFVTHLCLKNSNFGFTHK